jgi:hypothetical protein
MLYALLLSTSTMAQDNTSDWAATDRIGIYKSAEDGQLSKNMWDDYTQGKALEALNRLPASISSPAYRSVVERLLLSSSPAKDENIDAPALLAKRLHLLIRYGMLEEARSLINEIPDEYNLQKDIDITTVLLQLSLFDGELAPACLDIQASLTQFRDMPAWRELADFCRYRFGDQSKIRLSDIQFSHNPSLITLLRAGELKYDRLNNTEILLAHADRRLFANNNYNKEARNAEDLPDLVVYAGSEDRYQNEKTYQCFVIESVKRGLRHFNFLENAYKNVSFDEDLLKGNGGEIRLHPCEIAAFFYQKAGTTTGENNKNILINALLKATESMPAAALVPFHDYLLSIKIEPENKWRAAVILALANQKIPESLMPVAFPLLKMQSQQNIDEKTYIEWANIPLHEKILEHTKTDIAAPLYISQILSDEINKLRNPHNNNLYENIFSLTYEKKSLNLGLGFTGFMAETFKNENQIAVLTRGLGLMGENPVNAYSIEDVAVILSAFEAYKLEKESVMLAFEYLQ